MTIAIGIISKHTRWDGDKGQIIVACESETTFEVAKSQNAKKLHIIQFQNGKALAAYAGSTTIGDAVIEKMQLSAKTVTIENAETIANLAEDSMKQVRTHLQSINQNLNIDWQRYFWVDYPLNLLIAYFFEGNPYLYTITIDTALRNRVRPNFIGVGIGKELAEFLLKEYQSADAGFEYPHLIATAVIEKVKDNVKGCGGPTWVGIAEHVSDSKAAGDFGKYKDGDIIPAEAKCDAFICRRELIDEIVAETEAQEKKFQAKKSKQLYDTTTSICKRIGAIIYTESNDADGDGGLRISGVWKNKKDMERAAKKFMNRHKNIAQRR